VGLTHNDLEHFAVHKLKLAVLDGSQFGENGAGFLRLNLGTQRSRVETAMERIAEAAR
jgi:cystathionine beta-lyase